MEPTIQVSGEQQTLFSLEELTVTKVSTIEELKKQVRLTREMIKNAYAQSEDYTRQFGLVKEEKQQLKQIKDEVDKTPTQKSLTVKLQDLNRELREKEEEQSIVALEYARQSGKNQIERDGAVFDIVTIAKVVKRLR